MIKKLLILSLALWFCAVSFTACKNMKSYDVSGTSKGHEYVDLGLSVKWATCNVGAGSVSEVGGYFAWGETEQKSNYDISNYKYQFDSTTFTKYCCNANWGTVDNLKILQPSDDVASSWGGSWRMPSKDEMQELIDKCSWELKSEGYFDNGKLHAHKYYKITGPSGKSLHLPLCGLRGDDRLAFLDVGVLYWSNSLYEFESGDPGCAYFLAAYTDTSLVAQINTMPRGFGMPVRPVLEESLFGD
jgi:hypothetical protein